MSAADYGMVLTTLPSREEAARIANLLIDEKLAACVQLLPIESFYRWDGTTRNEPEMLLLVKTRAALFETAIAKMRVFRVPEFLGAALMLGLLGTLLLFVSKGL